MANNTTYPVTLKSGRSWGNFTDILKFPNSAGNPLRADVHSELFLGDTLYCVPDGAEYVCTDAGSVDAGNATWTPTSGSSGSIGGTVVFDDFIAGVATGATNWSNFGSGAGSGVTVNTAEASATRPGVVRLSTGNSPSGRAIIARGDQVMRLPLFNGGCMVYEAMVRIETLSVVGNDYFSNFGWSDNPAANPPTTGIIFKYDGPGPGAGARWFCSVYKTASEIVSIDTGLDVTTGWTRLRISYDYESGLNYYIGSSPGELRLVGSVPANDVNVLGSDPFAPQIKVRKQSGNTPINIFCDYIMFRNVVTGGR